MQDTPDVSSEENEEEALRLTEECTDEEEEVISNKCSKDLSNNLPNLIRDGNTV